MTSLGARPGGPRRLDDAARAKIAALLASGLSIEIVSTRFGIGRKIVRAIARKAKGEA